MFSQCCVNAVRPGIALLLLLHGLFKPQPIYDSQHSCNFRCLVSWRLMQTILCLHLAEHGELS